MVHSRVTTSVIVLPMLLSHASAEAWWQRMWWQRFGFSSHGVSLYQKTLRRQPSFYSLIGRSEEKKLAAEINRLPEPVIVAAIEQKIEEERVQGRQVVLYGSGYGGMLALHLAAQRRDLVGVIALYPHLEMPLEVLDKTAPQPEQAQVPTLIIFGEEDQKIGKASLDRARVLKESGHLLVDVEWIKGANHAFANPFLNFHSLPFFNIPLYRWTFEREARRLIQQWLTSSSYIKMAESPKAPDHF